MKIKEKINEIIKYPVIICFAGVILCIFALYFIVPDKEMSEWENRYLSAAPEFRFGDIVDGSFMSKYEDYINDQIPFRDEFIKLKAVLEACMFKCENNGIAKGKDSYLFTKSVADTSTFDKNIEIIKQFTSGVSNNVIIAIAPNSCGVLRDKVPMGLLMPDQVGKLGALYTDNSLLKSARVVDLKSVLATHEDEYIYYKTDHHWTTLGAYYAYSEISSNPVSIDDIEQNYKASYRGDFLGTLYAKYKGILVNPDVITYYDIPVKKYYTDDTLRDGLLDKDKLNVFDKYGMFMYGNYGICRIDASDEVLRDEARGKKLIVFKDSYANCLIPFLTYDYENITVIDLRYYKESAKELVEKEQDADILFLYNFDFMNEDNHFYKLMK